MGQSVEACVTPLTALRGRRVLASITIPPTRAAVVVRGRSDGRLGRSVGCLALLWPARIICSVKLVARGVRVSPAMRRVLRDLREERGLTRSALAQSVDAQLPPSPVTGHPRSAVTTATIEKIERGQPVERHKVLPVLCYLGIRQRPPTAAPRSGADPGQWLRSLREAHGISPREFCSFAKYEGKKGALSPTTLGSIERGEAVSFFIIHSLRNGFGAFGIEIDNLFRLLRQEQLDAARRPLPDAPNPSALLTTAAKMAPGVLGAAFALSRVPVRLVAGAEDAFIDRTALYEEIRRLDALAHVDVNESPT